MYGKEEAFNQEDPFSVDIYWTIIAVSENKPIRIRELRFDRFKQ